MSKFKAYKFWIGDDPKCSERVQKMLFDMGYQWYLSRTKIAHTLDSFIYTDVEGDITYTNDYGKYVLSGHEEVNIDWLRTPKAETIELNGKKYIKVELEEALKHINPVD